MSVALKHYHREKKKKIKLHFDSIFLRLATLLGSGKQYTASANMHFDWKTKLSND